MNKKLISLIVCIASVIGSYSQNTEAQRALSNLDKQFFIENKGQWPTEVLYVTRIGGLDAWITNNGVLYDFYKMEEEQQSTTIEALLPDKFEHKNFTRYGHRVWYKLQGNNTHVTTESKEKQEAYYNYLIGNDLSKHASNVGLYKEVTVKNVYNGIDIRYYFNKGCIRYDYVVHPGAEPSQITFVLEGTDKTYLNQEGNLVFNTRFGEVALAELHTYQNTKDNKVSSRFVKTENGYSITVGNYNINHTLIIDPLVYSTYLSGSMDDVGHSIAIDASGNAYVTGYTLSTNYDTTLGVYQTSNSGNYEVFVTKLNTTGTALVYSTYLGTSDYEMVNSIVVDASGNAYITGGTTSTNYYVTTGVYQTSFAGGYYDAFVTKLNSTGTALVYSTYLGGNNIDIGHSIAIDASDNAYVTGHTTSTNYDTTSGAYRTGNGGPTGTSDVFITKLNATGTALVYSTYLGGSDSDYGRSIALDAGGNAYVSGYTTSTDYDTTSGAFQTSYEGNRDVFITKLNTSGNALVYSTYLGGSDHDLVHSNSIAVDASNNAYVIGKTTSIDYDITSGAYQTTNAGLYDVFITKINTTGNALVYSTYLGGSGNESGQSIAISASGYAYVTGYTNSTNYDITFGAYQTSNIGGQDVFVTKLNATGTSLLYSTYLGGGGDDFGNSITIDATGNAFVTGSTASSNYVTTSGAYNTSFEGGVDVFVTKIYMSTNPIGIANQTNKAALQLFPNPANTEVYFKWESAALIQIEIIDASGRISQADYLYDNHTIKLNVSSLTNGMYWIRIIDKGEVFQSNIIVQH